MQTHIRFLTFLFCFLTLPLWSGCFYVLEAEKQRQETVRQNSLQQCSEYIKKIELSLHDYLDSNSMCFPPLYTVAQDGKPLHSWRVLLLPFLGEQDLYEKIRLDEPWDSNHNKQFHSRMPSVYQCPSNSRKGCCYSVIAGKGFVPDRSGQGRYIREFMGEFIGGTSNVIAIVEVKEPFNWMDPTADVDLEELLKGINSPRGRVSSFHTGGMNVGMFDGAVWFFPDSVETDVLRSLAEPADDKGIGVEYIWFLQSQKH